MLQIRMAGAVRHGCLAVALGAVLGGLSACECRGPLPAPSVPADAAGGEALLEAAAEGDLESAVGLMVGGVAPDYQDRSGTAALHLAAASPDGTAMITVLLDSRATVSVRDGFGQTPLHLAAFFGRVENVELLLGRGAKVDAVDSFGATPLHVAVTGGNVSIVQALLDAGADPMVKDNQGSTAFRRAIVSSQHEVLAVLRRSRGLE